MDFLDVNLYSRQISTYGLETMQKLLNMNILIYGLRGLGLEISKNIILAGVKKVSIFDDNKCNINDLSSNFYINEDDIPNKRRDEACIEKLSELNPYVVINKINTSNDFKNEIKNYDVIIITEIIEKEILFEYNKICRENKKGFIYTSNLGLAGFLFVDFGDEHVIFNEIGSDPLTFYVTNITQENEGVITIDNNNEHNLNNLKSHYVIFKNIKGMTELNEQKPIKIKILSTESFSIGNTSNFQKYISGGIVKEIYVPFKIKFYSLEESFLNPFTDDTPGQSLNMKKGEKELFHICIIALHYFYSINNFLPELNNKTHYLQILELVKLLIQIGKEKEWIKKINMIDEKFIENIIRWCRSSISPICSFLGGIVSQEIIKFTGKYTPISQWFYFNFFETTLNLQEHCDRNLKNTRYNEQISIFGNEIQEKLSDLNIFMIGAGALGCEFLKNFALMGIGTNKNKIISVTDNDSIELSNLNRQFLFRNSDIGKSKSLVACRESKIINKELNLKYYNLKLDFENENIFNDSFWEEQDLIISAVDNESARSYIDNWCTFFNKKFLDCGTMGTEASSFVFFPKKTICYNDIESPSNKIIPSCTLKQFPSSIEHCIEYGKIKFHSFFEKKINDINLLLNNYNDFFLLINKNNNDNSKIYSKLEKIKDFLFIYKNKNIDELIKLALEQFHKCFNKKIEFLLKQYPADSIENGALFWSGSRIMPTPIIFNPDDEISLNFIYSFCKIYERILKFNSNYDITYIKEKSATIYPLILEKDSTKNNNDNIEENIENIKKEIINLINNDNNINNELIPETFDKDNLELYHVDFVYSFSNLRARNYSIEERNKEIIRTIAGNIVPALASTTAVIAGFVSLQIYTILQTDDIKYMKNIGLNLGTSWFSISHPEEVNIIKDYVDNNIIKIKAIPSHYTVWDNIEIKGPLTVKEFFEYFKNKYNVEIEFLNYGSKCIFDNLDETNIDDSNKTIEEIFMQSFEKGINFNKKYLRLSFLGYQENIEVKMPIIKYIIEK